MKDTVDGVPWSKFREEYNSSPIKFLLLHSQEDAVGFRIKNSNGEEVHIVLFRDGTWEADCAPDWNGAS